MYPNNTNQNAQGSHPQQFAPDVSVSKTTAPHKYSSERVNARKHPSHVGCCRCFNSSQHPATCSSSISSEPWAHQSSRYYDGWSSTWSIHGQLHGCSLYGLTIPARFINPRSKSQLIRIYNSISNMSLIWFVFVWAKFKYSLRFWAELK